MTWAADATALADLDRCEEFFVKRHVENLAEVEESAALTQGKEVHALLARWWVGEAIESAPPWLDEYAKQRAEVRVANQVLLVEEPVYLGGYGGVPDLVLLGEHGVVLVVDHKTTAKPLTAAWVEQWALSEQFAGYLDLVEATLLEKGIEFSDIVVKTSGLVDNPRRFVSCGSSWLPPTKVVVDALQFAKPKARKFVPKDSTGLDGEWITEDVEVPVSRRVGSVGDLVATGWYEFAVPLGLCQELAVARVIKTQRALDLRDGATPLKRTRSCYAWGRACPYLPMCRLGTQEHRAAMRDILIESGVLEVREWDFANRKA